MTSLDRSRLAGLLQAEGAVYAQRNPESYELYKQSCECLFAGVPMPWMVRVGLPRAHA